MDFMKTAYELAILGIENTYPNPMVGAIIVYKGEIIGKGFHEKYGGNHAEKNAVEDVYRNGFSNLLKNSTMYVTLEPCNHYGKTPPCVELIIKEQIKVVHISLLDPNPLMQGKSVEILERSGVIVKTGHMSEYGKQLNSKFISKYESKLPYVTMKTAMTLDGKIASKNYDSKWITNEQSRKMVHTLRKNNCSILTSYKTANIDNPSLNIRFVKSEHKPIPIIIDKDLNIDKNLELFKIHKKIYIVTSKLNKENKKEIDFDCLSNLAEIKYIYVSENEENKLDLIDSLRQLKENGIDSILVETGGTLSWEFIKSNLVDEYYVFIAPKLLGGKNSVSSVEGTGFNKISESVNLKFTDVEFVASDILIRGKRICSQE